MRDIYILRRHDRILTGDAAAGVHVVDAGQVVGRAVGRVGRGIARAKVALGQTVDDVLQGRAHHWTVNVAPVTAVLDAGPALRGLDQVVARRRVHVASLKGEG